MKIYNCYQCGCFSDPPCQLRVIEESTVIPKACPLDCSYARWELEGDEIPFGSCTRTGCGGHSTTYKTVDGVIHSTCPDCGHKEVTEIIENKLTPA